MVSRWLTICITFLLGLAALAQPPPDETWLIIQPALPDGGVLPAKAYVRLVRLDGETRTVMPGRPSFSADGRVAFNDIAPGYYEAMVYFPTLGLFDAPRKITVTAGYTTVNWLLPPITLVRPAPTVEDKPVTPAEAQFSYLPAAGGAVTTPALAPTPATAPDAPLQFAVFPGAYRLAYFSDKGYAVAEFDTAKAKDGVLVVPLPLKPGGVVAVTVSNSKARPIFGVAITLTRDVAKGFPVTLTLSTQDEGDARSPMLPSGEWEWTAARKGYQPQNDTLTLTAGEEIPLEIELLKAK